MITSTLTHTELHRVTPSEKCNDNVHIDSHQVASSHTESHRLSTCQRSNDNVHIDSHGVTQSHTESHRLATCQKSNDNVPRCLTPSHNEWEM